MTRSRYVVALVSVVSAATACNAGAPTTRRITEAQVKPTPPVVVAPLMVLQFLVKERTGPSTPVTAVVQSHGSLLRFRFLLCPTLEPRCTETTEEVEGRFTLPNGSSGHYAIQAETGRWAINLSGTSAKATALVHSCPFPGKGGTIEVSSSDMDRIAWGGTINGQPYNRMACNFYVRTGTARISTNEPD